MSDDGSHEHAYAKLGRYLKGDAALSPGFVYWVPAILTAVYISEVRGRRRLPKPPVDAKARSYYSPSAGQYLVLVIPQLATVITVKNSLSRTDVDRDLRTVHDAARRYASKRHKADDGLAAPPERDSAGLGPGPSRTGLSYVAWKIRGHLILDDRAWSYFYRTLALRYADKYPDITPADWDVCVSHFARNAFVDETMSPLWATVPFFYWTFGGVTVIHWLAEWRWTSRPRIVTLGLNALARGAWYGWATCGLLPLLPFVLALPPPTQLQNKRRVAEMLREAFPGLD